MDYQLMGCFTVNLTDPIELVFYGLSLFQAYRAVQLLIVIVQTWQPLVSAPLTRAKMGISEQAAFYLAVPPAVLFHEFCHALAIWAFGGRVVQCGYGFYWGFVAPDRVFTTPQQWFISLAGTLGSLTFGLVVWLLLRNHASKSLRFFSIRALRFQLYFSLIYYPIFTAFTFIGDWRVIYDFRATPVPSALTAVAHALLLLAMWLVDRNGGFEMVGHDNASDEAAFEQIEKEMAHNPSAEAQLRYVDALRRGGGIRKAERTLKQFIAQNPQSAEGYLQLGLLQIEGQKTAPANGIDNLKRALLLGIGNPRSAAYAHQLIGRHQLYRNELQPALDHFHQAIQLVQTDKGDNASFLAHLYFLRSQASMRLQQFETAVQDLQQAIQISRNRRDDAAVTYYQQQFEILENHAGRKFDH